MTRATPLILASGSSVRAELLRRAGLVFQVLPGRIDEEAIRNSHVSEGGSPRDLADLLAELKAEKVSDRHPGALIIGADQVLECDGCIYGKAESREEAAEHLRALSGQTHRLWSAAVVCRDGKPLWRWKYSWGEMPAPCSQQNRFVES